MRMVSVIRIGIRFANPNRMKAKIGILGSGQSAISLAAGFLDQGHEVMIGTSSPAKAETLRKSTGALSGTFAETAAFGDILVLAVKGTAAIKVFSNLDAHDVEGKPVIDITNPISDVPPKNGVLQYFTTQNDSLMAQLQKAQPGAWMVKAFNSVGNAKMYKPGFRSKPTMFICGENAEAKKAVKEILDSFGWEAEDMGGLDSAGSIESLCILWCIRGFRENQWGHAFRLLK